EADGHANRLGAPEPARIRSAKRHLTHEGNDRDRARTPDAGRGRAGLADGPARSDGPDARNVDRPRAAGATRAIHPGHRRADGLVDLCAWRETRDVAAGLASGNSKHARLE